MIVKNEEKYIQRCLNSVKGIVDEIVIVDTGSTDNTIGIVSKYPGVKLFHFNWCDDFSSARNHSIVKATGDYILVLDADEYLINGERYDFERVMYEKSIGRILIESRFKKENQEYRSEAYVSRFFPKNVRYVGAIHEQLESDRPRLKINAKVNHDGYYEVKKSSRNIPLLIKEVKKKPNDPYTLFQLGKELRISERYRESFHFLERSYELVNNNSQYYGELVVELINSGKEYGENKIFNIISQNEQRLENLSDYHFAKGNFYMDYCIENPSQAENYIGKIESSFLNCISLEENSKIEYLQGTGSFLATYNLGVFYEVIGNIEKALYYFESSSKCGYLLAEDRINILNERKNSIALKREIT